MQLKEKFIRATENYNTLDDHVPAYYFRGSFLSDGGEAKLTIAVCGLYELYFNGKKLTRGLLSPYISNPNHMVYYDEYRITPEKGENVVGVILGNGFQNNPGGHIWDFHIADFRSAPKFALEVTRDAQTLLESGTGFKIMESPVRSDDYRFGEHYDANYEIPGWCEPGFDDAAWGSALKAEAPLGELRLADVEPIVKECELTPVAITPCGNGYIYDFGQCNSGVCRLLIRGEKGQKIELRHADTLKDGDLDLGRVWFVRENWEHDKDIVHLDTYVCKGDAEEVYEPSFTYHGFRYVRVNGITAEQAVPELLTYLVYHTKLNDRGGFACSDDVANQLQTLTRRSIVSNFHHFPTDCPQREKNGWTADAALSSEAAMLNFDPERNYREWLRNIRKAQTEEGKLPGIVPTGGWGYHWGNGPAWDSVMTYLPYFVYIYRGETEMIEESVDAFVKYLGYLRSRCDENGLLAIGLGDWCHVGGIEPKAPLIVTDSVITMDLANKMADMFTAVGREEEAAFARLEAEKYRSAIHAYLIDPETLVAKGACQSSQAMCLFYGVYEEEERQQAFEVLLKLIHDQDDHIDLGVLGGRVIFHVLTEFGYSDLAYKMITREDFPSYGNWLKQGATTLWESFHPKGTDSMNHHFWGDISAWFIKCIAGIRLNPGKHDVNTVEICPNFINALDHAEAYHLAPGGKILSAWQRQGERILLTLEIPGGMQAAAKLPVGYRFENGEQQMAVATGAYTVQKIM